MSAVEIHSDQDEKDDAPLNTNIDSVESATGIRLDTDEEEAIVSSTPYSLEKKDGDYSAE